MHFSLGPCFSIDYTIYSDTAGEIMNTLPTQSSSLEGLATLDTCYDIFKCAENVYQYLASVHTSHTEIARMWGELAVDKCNHADTFRMAARLKGQGVRKIHDSAGTVQKTLVTMKSISLERSGQIPTVESALRFSLKMEELLAQVHFHVIVEFNNQQDGRLLTSSLQPSNSLLHMLTEEYVNATMFA